MSSRSSAPQGAKKMVAVIIAVTIIAAVAAIFPSPDAPAATEDGDTRTPHYYNGDVQDTDHEFNFGPDVYALTGEDIKKTEAELYVRRSRDPALAAAHAFYWDAKITQWNADHPNDQRELLLQEGGGPDEAHLRFLDGFAVWDETANKTRAVESACSVAIRDIGSSYESQMWMAWNGLEGDKPSVVTRSSEGVGGHELVFSHPDYGEVKFRLECGFQPDTTGWWSPPAAPAPGLAPKDPAQDPAKRGNALVGGGVNDDPGPGNPEPRPPDPPPVREEPASPDPVPGGGTKSPDSPTHAGSEDPSGEKTEPGGDAAESGSSDTGDSSGYDTPPENTGDGTYTGEEGQLL